MGVIKHAASVYLPLPSWQRENFTNVNATRGMSKKNTGHCRKKSILEGRLKIFFANAYKLQQRNLLLS